jgi:hypothetical protein
MNTFQHEDLVIGFTTQFTMMWNDKSSGGKRDGSFWHPEVPAEMAGFFPVGSLALDHHNSPNGKIVIAIVKDANNEQGTALAPPVDYEQVWTDAGSGAGLDGSMWRPIPPDGYAAMGLVCNPKYTKPSKEMVRCIRSDLVVPAYPGDLIWDDKGTGAKKDFGSWKIDPPSAPSGWIYLSAGTYIGRDSHNKPASDPNAYALRLEFHQEAPENQSIPVPRLQGIEKPSPFGKDSVSYTTILPWFAVHDPDIDAITQLVKSPHYCLERTDRYKLMDFGYNDTSVSQDFELSYTTGVNTQESTAFSSTTSIEIGAEWAVSGAFKLSAKLSRSFTHTSSSTTGWSQSTTKTKKANVPSGKAVALYSIQSTYRMFRADGTQVRNLGVSYDTESSTYWTEYPLAGDHVEMDEKKPGFLSGLILLLTKIIGLLKGIKR